MLIPNKFNGYSRDGIRLYHFGGGGGGEAAPTPAPPPPRMASAAPPPAYTTYGSGDRTGSMVQSGSSFRPSRLDYSKPIYDPNYADNITGYQDSSQFYQPIQQQQYANYTNPLTAFNVSSYGTNPGMSKSMREAIVPGGIGAGEYYKELQNYGTADSRIRNVEPGGINFNTMLQDMRRYNMSAQDFQNASSYNPAPSGVGGNKTQPYVDPSTPQSTGLADIPQMQTPFNYQPSQSTQFNPYTNNFGATAGAFPTQTPFSYQTASRQPKTPFSYQQPAASGAQQNNGLSYSAPMQLPQYVYDTIRDIDSYQSQPVQAYKSPRATSSGPSQAIVGRSSQMRGAPNVAAASVTKAKGGIASLLKKHK